MTERSVLPRPETEIRNKHIAIIGGGPAGALTAYLLAKQGVPVDVFEPRSTKRPNVSLGEKIPLCAGCAGLIQENTIGLLESLGLVMPETVIQARLKNNVIHFPHTDRTVTIPSKAVTIYRGFSPIKQVEGTNIESFDAWLLDEAIKAGAEHHLLKVNGIMKENETIKLTTREGEFQADLIIGAYGHESSIQINGLASLEKPQAGKGCVREYYFGSQVLERLKNNKHVFGNPTKKIWFAGIFPKADHISIALMGRENVSQSDFNGFLNLPEVKELLGNEIVSDKPICGCTSSITIRSPNKFMAVNEIGELEMVNVGDAGPSRPRVNGIFSALDSARELVKTLSNYGTGKKALEAYQKYMDKQYIWDNYFAKRVLDTFDWILNNSLPREIVISLAHSQIGLIRALTINTMDYVISGKGPYWQLPIQVLEESLFN